MATKAVFLDYATMGAGLDTGPLTALFPELEFHDTTGPDEVAARMRDAEFVFTNKVRIFGDLFDAAPQLRFIGLVATGTDNIDIDTAARRGVAVCNTRGYATHSVTEHVFGLLLLLARNLCRYTADVAGGAWQKAPVFSLQDYPIRELSSMTMGIVGHGELGRSVANMARSFGMEVIVSARPGSDSVPAGRVSFDDLLAQADVISLHCPLTDDTQLLFGAGEFARMKQTSIFINTARGGLVDSAALVAALETGQIAAAGIDVLSQEPPVEGDPLLEHTASNLAITPHNAWASDRARQACIAQLVENVEAFLRGEMLRRVV